VKAQTRKVVDEVSGPAHADDSSGVDALATLKASNRRSPHSAGKRKQRNWQWEGVVAEVVEEFNFDLFKRKM
jgi:hypothetical protein